MLYQHGEAFRGEQPDLLLRALQFSTCLEQYFVSETVPVERRTVVMEMHAQLSF